MTTLCEKCLHVGICNKRLAPHMKCDKFKALLPPPPPKVNYTVISEAQKRIERGTAALEAEGGGKTAHAMKKGF